MGAALLRAKGCFARKQYAAARELLGKICERWPKAVAPRVTLSHVLLQEGQDWPAAAAALHAILDLDPGNAEAKHNLTVLRRRTSAKIQPPAAVAPRES
jgi:hypothetical protein